MRDGSTDIIVTVRSWQEDLLHGDLEGRFSHARKKGDHFSALNANAACQILHQKQLNYPVLCVHNVCYVLFIWF